MDDETAQAAAGMSAEDAKALGVLRVLWGDVYWIGYDDEAGWWAARRDKIGHFITAASAEELGKMIGDDFGPATS
jgi:hypothetical protein